MRWGELQALQVGRPSQAGEIENMRDEGDEQPWSRQSGDVVAKSEKSSVEKTIDTVQELTKSEGLKEVAEKRREFDKKWGTSTK